MGKGSGKGAGRVADALCCLEPATCGCGRGLCGCLTFMFIVGPVLAVVGIVLLAQATANPRGSAIGDYNAVVKTWVTSGYEQLRLQNPGFQGILANTTMVGFTNNTSPDQIVDSDSMINSYRKYLRFNAYGSFLAPSSTAAGKVSIKSSKTGIAYDIPVTAYLLTTLQPKQMSHCSTSSLQCANSCGMRNGYWSVDTYRCHLIQYVTDLCIVANDNGEANSLCYDPVYGDNQPDNLGAANPTPPRTLPPFTITIRSKKDPFIHLYINTGGTLDFGLSAGQLAGSGVALLVVGALIVAIIGFCAYVLYRQGNCLKCGHKHKKTHVAAAVAAIETGFAHPPPIPPEAFIQPVYPQQAQQSQLQSINVSQEHPHYISQQQQNHPQQAQQYPNEHEGSSSTSPYMQHQPAPYYPQNSEYTPSFSRSPRPQSQQQSLQRPQSQTQTLQRPPSQSDDFLQTETLPSSQSSSQVHLRLHEPEDL